MDEHKPPLSWYIWLICFPIWLPIGLFFMFVGSFCELVLTGLTEICDWCKGEGFDD